MFKQQDDIPISLYAHKDVVWFFVVSKNKNGTIMLMYGNIPEKYLKQGLILTCGKQKITLKTINKINKHYYICSFNNNNLIQSWDFLTYYHKETINNWYIVKPYLDNRIWVSLATRLKEKYPQIKLIQSFDEEKSLTYSCFPDNNDLSIVIDTIRQDFLKDPIDLDKVYSIKNTKYTKNINYIEHPHVALLDTNYNFPLEIDKIKTKNKKYMFMCAITEWHWPNSSAKLETIEKLYLVIELIIKWKIYWL